MAPPSRLMILPLKSEHFAIACALGCYRYHAADSSDLFQPGQEHRLLFDMPPQYSKNAISSLIYANLIRS